VLPLICIIIAVESLSTGHLLHNATSHHLSKRQALASVCSSQECKYGSCEITGQFTYLCHCRSGIQGTNCDTVSPAGTGPCAANPCFGVGSQCVNQGTVSFTCFCAAGLTGATCQSRIGSCACLNGGVCTAATLNGVATFQCACAAGFGGPLCQYRTTMRSCQILGCQNGGTCTILSSCSCPTGFTGTLCELSSVTTTAAAVTVPAISICAPGICLNGGTCIQLTTNIGFCSCPNGYYGLFCNIATATGVTVTTPVTTTLATTTIASAVIRCPFTNICSNGGTCNLNPVTNTVTCSCLPNYTGVICETALPFCQNNPCKNGATCVTGTGTAGTCTCPTGFEGVYCEISTTCPNNPCQNNQKCILLNGNPICLCGAGYNPPYCT